MQSNTIIRHRWFIMIVLLLSMIGWLQPLSAAEPTSGGLFETDGTSRPLKVGVFQNKPVVYFENGPKGLFVDILDTVAEKESWEIEYVFCELGEGLDNLSSGQLDLMTSLGENPERVKRFFFSKEPVWTFWGTIYANDTNINGVFDLAGKKIGVRRNNKTTASLKKLMSDFEIQTTFVYFDDYEQAFDALQNNNVDALAVNNTYAFSKQRKTATFHKTAIVFNPFSAYFAAAKTPQHQKVLDTIDRYVQAMKTDSTSVYNDFERKWFGQPSAATWTARRTGVLSAGLLVVVIIGMAVWRYVSIVGINRQLRNSITDRKIAERTLQESEHKFRTLFEKAAIGKTLNSIDGRFIDVNSSFCQITGYSRDVLLTKKWGDLVHPDFLEITAQQIDRMIKGRQDSFSHEVKSIHKEGHIYWARVNVVLLRDQNDKSQFLFADVEDVTQAKEAELSVQQSEEKFRTAFEFAAIGRGIALPEGPFVEVNQAFAEMLGMAVDELEQKSWQDITHTDYLERSYQLVRRLTEEALSADTMEMKLMHADGSPVWVRLNCTLLRDTKGEPLHLIGDIENITERKRAETALRDSEELFRSAFRTHPDAININRLRDGVYIDINDGFEQLTGFTREEVIGTSSLKINIWDNPEERNLLVKGLTENGQVNNLEAKFRMKDGRVRTGLMSASIIQLQGEPHILSVTRNIEQRKQMERQLRESEGKFRLAFDSAIVGRAIVGLDTTILQANASVAGILGLSRGEMEGQSWLPLMHSDSQEEALALVGDLTERKIPSAEMLAKLVHKEGHTVWARIFTVLAWKDSEEPLYLIVDVEDITQQKYYEDMLKKYEQIVSASKDLMGLISREYVYEAVNDMYLQYHRRPREEIVGKSIPELMGASVFDQKIRPRFDRVLNGETINYQEEFDYKEHGKRVMDVTYFPVKNDRGAVEAIALSARDITESKRMEGLLAEAQKMESIGTLAGGIAHDFNNLLGVIIGQAELIDMFYARDNPDIRSGLGDLLHASKRAKDLVNQILTFSRQTERERMLVNIVPIVKETVRFLRSSLPSTVEIEASIAPGSYTTLAHPTDIHQILMNMGTNAAHAMENSGGRLTIKLDRSILDDVSAEQYIDLGAGEYVQLAVSDTGSGIPPEIRNRIFEPYFTTKKAGKGTGLGLAVIHGIIKSLGGSISVYSEIGQGTTFKIWLPLVSDQANQDVGVTEEALARGSERILLVDDEISNLNTIGAILEQLGYQVAAAQSGPEALNFCKTASPAFDLVITDMTMPQMTGLELAGTLKETRPNLPVILCTGFSERLTQEQVRQAGIRLYLEKPIVMKALAAAVRNVLDDSQ